MNDSTHIIVVVEMPSYGLELEVDQKSDSELKAFSFDGIG
jgi:hypothetical protein